VVYLDRSSFLRSVILHSGEGRLAEGQPVVSADGVVGRVLKVAGNYARAQLVTDSAAGVGAMLERSGSQGLVRGSGDGRLTLEYVPHQVAVEPGDRVVTAGIDGVFPPGILIGQVLEVAAGEELFHRITLAPAVDFGRLQQVFVLDRQELPKELKSQESGAVP
jgi:rod shape-determining protein MreC